MPHHRICPIISH